MADPKDTTPRPEHLEHAEESFSSIEKKGAEIINYDLSDSHNPPVDPPPGSDD